MGETPSDRKVALVEAPPIEAKGHFPFNHTCFCCGKRAASDVQLPDEVFTVAYTMRDFWMVENHYESTQSPTDFDLPTIECNETTTLQ